MRSVVTTIIRTEGALKFIITECYLNSDLYRDILEERTPQMEEICPDGFYYQHDNLRTHTACGWYLEEAGVEQIPYPAYSLDLSPIGNL